MDISTLHEAPAVCMNKGMHRLDWCLYSGGRDKSRRYNHQESSTATQITPLKLDPGSLVAPWFQTIETSELKECSGPLPDSLKPGAKYTRLHKTLKASHLSKCKLHTVHWNIYSIRLIPQTARTLCFIFFGSPESPKNIARIAKRCPEDITSIVKCVKLLFTNIMMNLKKK